PFTTIQEAYDVVVPGGQIAVATGEYEERLVIDKEVRLTGRCAELVTIRGGWWLGQPQPPVCVNSGGSGTSIQGVTLTGAGVGLSIQEATDVSVASAQILEAGGWGVHARLGSLSIDRTLIAGNGDLGLILLGVEVTIASSVVRATTPVSSNGGGRGIEAQCDPGGQGCGWLDVTGSLIASNTGHGVLLSGPGAVISGSVVRNTVPNSEGNFGRGIGAQCDPLTQVCRSLDVVGSLVTGNAEAGLYLNGMETTITRTVVHDTHLRADGGGGRGIDAQCDPDGLGCGSVHVVDNLVKGNADTGARFVGMEAAITKSLVASNANIGLMLTGAEATVTGSVVRDTQVSASGVNGRGIVAQCHPGGLSCGRLTVTGSLVRGNVESGFRINGVEAAITGSLVRDTQPAINGMFGWGIEAICHSPTQICASLVLTDSLVRSSSEIGLFFQGADATISGSVVRETQPNAMGEYGQGIHAQCDPDIRGCGHLDLTGSLIAVNSCIGVLTSGVPISLSSVAVVDTRQNSEGQWAGEYGEGVFAVCDEVTSDCGTLDLTACLVDSSLTVGVAVQAVSGFMLGTVVRQVEPRALDGAYGYGLQVEGVPGAPPTVFDITASRIQDAALAGILYVLAGGTVSGSQITGGQYTIVMNQGANPVIQDDNDLSGNIESEPAWVTMNPAPAPEPLLPWE
ncbi:hypothetical protein ACFL51_01840, partial [Myxococcota bacterium]